MEVAFDVTKADPSVFSKMTTEQLADESHAPESPGGAKDPASAEQQGSNGAAPGATDAEVKPQEGTQAADKKDVASASSSASEADAKTAENDKEHNFAIVRAAKRRLEQELAESQRQNDELQRKLQEQGVQAVPVDLASIDKRITELQEKAKDVAEAAPAVAEDYLHAAEDLLTMRSTLVRSEQDRLAMADREKKRARDEVVDESQAAIDANQVLSHWQKTDIDAFNLAADQDAVLRGLPEWANKPLSERFDKAVEIVKMLRPNASLPESAPAIPPQGEKKPEPKTEAKPAAPIRSLTDVPGGIPPAKDLNEAVSETSPVVLGSQFSRMSRAEQEAWLSAP